MREVLPVNKIRKFPIETDHTRRMLLRLPRGARIIGVSKFYPMKIYGDPVRPSAFVIAVVDDTETGLEHRHLLIVPEDDPASVDVPELRAASFIGCFHSSNIEWYVFEKFEEPQPRDMTPKEMALDLLTTTDPPKPNLKN